MPKKLTALILLMFIISIDIIYGKDTNKTKPLKKKYTNIREKNKERLKRSLNEKEANAVWLNKVLKVIPESPGYDDVSEDKIPSNLNTYRQLEVEPFWATRGRRDSSTAEDYADTEYSVNVSPKLENVICKGCPTPSHLNYRNVKIKHEYSPFWGNRGRRDSDDNESPGVVFWGSRGRREDNEPFWGNRGRRRDDPSFWDYKGRREDEPFWGNRGRRQNKESRNRFNRYEDEPFWGNRGRREDTEPFWGNRGKRDLKEPTLTAIDNLSGDIEKLSRLRQSEAAGNSFWANRGRESTLKFLPITGRSPVRTKMLLPPNSGTVHDSRVYAEQPSYILVERSSRSSGEEDPYFISRGKKYYLNYSLIKAARDRRGAIEEIVKSVRNDPYYIARGKKRREDSRVINGTKHEELQKVKDLVCSTIDLITTNNQNGKVKREINDNDRDRRTILKKLAAQLQVDPYFASRGKKNEYNAGKDYLNDFINNLAEKCDY